MTEGVLGQRLPRFPSRVTNQVKALREASRIERCHMHPHHLPYSIGQHTHDLLTLLILTWTEEHGVPPSQSLLLAATFHDAPERVTGDIAYQVKVEIRNRGGGEVLDQMDRHFHTLIGRPEVTDPSLTEDERRWLNHCDMTELFLWACDEAAMGNQSEGGFLANRIIAHWKQKGYPPGAIGRVVTDVLKGGWKRLSNNLAEME